MGQINQFLPFLLMFVVIYFFMIRPQQKKIKQEKEFERDLFADVSDLKKGVYVMSILNDEKVEFTGSFIKE